MDAPLKRDGKKPLRFLALAATIVIVVSVYIHQRNREFAERTIYSQDTISLQYLWLDNNRLLINTFRQGASNTIWRSETGVVHPGANSISTARDMSAVTGLSPDATVGKVSPDGRHLLFGDQDGNISTCDTSYVLGDSGRPPVFHTYVYNSYSGGQARIAWGDDSQDWIGIQSDNGALNYYLRAKGHDRRLQAKNSTRYYRLLPNLSVLGYIDRSTVLLFAFEGGQNPDNFKIHLLTMDVNTGAIASDRLMPIPADVDTSLLGVPLYCNPFSAVLSPDKKQIAYLLPSTPKPMFPHSQVFARIRSSLTRWHILQPPPDTAIWISDIDGGHLRTVDQWSRGKDQDYDLEWRPDGKALSWMHIKGTQNTVSQSFSAQMTVQGDLSQGGSVTKVSILGSSINSVYSIKTLRL